MLDYLNALEACQPYGGSSSSPEYQYLMQYVTDQAAKCFRLQTIGAVSAEDGGDPTDGSGSTCAPTCADTQSTDVVMYDMYPDNQEGLPTPPSTRKPPIGVETPKPVSWTLDNYSCLCPNCSNVRCVLGSTWLLIYD